MRLMRLRLSTAIFFAFLIIATTAFAQTDQPPQTPPDQGNPQATTTPPTLSDTAAGAYDRRDSLPSVNVYLPEGQATIRLRKLIRNVLFESQIDYRFVNGDISTFLR